MNFHLLLAVCWLSHTRWLCFHNETYVGISTTCRPAHPSSTGSVLGLITYKFKFCTLCPEGSVILFISPFHPRDVLLAQLQPNYSTSRFCCLNRSPLHVSDTGSDKTLHVYEHDKRQCITTIVLQTQTCYIRIFWLRWSLVLVRISCDRPSKKLTFSSTAPRSLTL